jgi:hypothetical protein
MRMDEIGEGGSRWVLWRMDDLLFLQNGRHFGKCTDFRFRFQTNRQGAATMLLLLLVLLNLAPMYL